MKWLELSVQTPPEFVEPLSQIFHRYGHGGVALETVGGFNPDEGESQPEDAEVVVRTYLPLDSTAGERRERIAVGVQLVASLVPLPPLSARVIEEEAWQESWKRHFHVLRVGRRIVICPTWREHRSQPNEIVLQLDPGMAFGTGHHPTTRMCLEALDTLTTPGCRVLDVGCGSGILAIAAAKLGASVVVGVEIDEPASRVAEENVRRNGVEGFVTIVHGTLDAIPLPAHRYDLVLANISAKVVSDISGLLVDSVTPGGRVIVSGIIGDRRAEVAKRLEHAGLVWTDEMLSEDWVTLIYAAANRAPSS